METVSQFSGILAALEEPAAILSPDYKIIAANDAYIAHYKGSDAVVGHHCYEVSHHYDVPCDQAGESCPLRECQRTGRRQRVLHLHNTRHGEEHVDVEMIPITDSSGRVSCYLEKMQVVKEAAASPEEQGLVGRSPAFMAMLELVHRAAPSDISVLLLGESGTGKELVAQAIHQASRRKQMPFVTVECSGLSEALFESELFGHEKGAFTGAVSSKEGLVEAARGGTLFLDELGDVPLALQVKLLRLIETGTYRRVGSVTVHKADFRLVCATHKALPDMIEAGTFRKDLYYRVSAFPIPLPSLSQRGEDLALLVETLLKRIPEGSGYHLSARALEALAAYAFPGNIRELRNILERGMLLTDDNVIDIAHLPHECANRTEPLPTEQQFGCTVVPLHELESCYLAHLVSLYPRNKKLLAEQLGISERTLYRKLTKADALMQKS
ncbi:sigma-54-dependent Fis family transcriptional regulator [Neptunomonas sp. XY-337]|uniref:sigma-54 interaction domain-containing protein n=1 Tax=Neptunomonas sp. XY-337 TaxID=2561897 RepID=UPI001F110F55|nr:sigma-54-dependent Fis family transcriptional regulator [Neptunomonas sp. XY-337]